MIFLYSKWNDFSICIDIIFLKIVYGYLYNIKNISLYYWLIKTLSQTVVLLNAKVLWGPPAPSFDMLLWLITLINFLILSQSYIPNMIPINLDILPVLYIDEFSVLIFCLAFLASVLLSDTCNLLSCVVLVWVGISVILGLQNWLGVLVWIHSIYFCSVPLDALGVLFIFLQTEKTFLNGFWLGSDNEEGREWRWNIYFSRCLLWGLHRLAILFNKETLLCFAFVLTRLFFWK